MIYVTSQEGKDAFIRCAQELVDIRQESYDNQMKKYRKTTPFCLQLLLEAQAALTNCKNLEVRRE